MKQHQIKHPVIQWSLKLLAFAGLLFGWSSAAQTWTDISANVPGTITGGNQGVMATDGARLYVLGATGVFVSEDGGATFTAINTVQGASYNLGQYGHRFVGVANGLVWVGTDPGSAAFNDGLATLHRLTPGQTTWQKSSTGFPVGTTGNQAEDIAYDASSGTYYAVGALGGVFVSTDGVNWESRNNGNGGFGLPATVEAFNGVAFAVRPLGGVNRTTDQGLNWTATGGIPGPGSGTLLRLGNRLLIATQGYTTLQDGLYYSDDLGVTWTFNQEIPNQYDLTTDGTLGYAAGNDFFNGPQIRFSATGGTTWDALPATGITGSPTRVLKVGDQFFVHTSGKLFRGAASGFTFNPATKIVRQPVSSTTLLEGGSYTFSVIAGGANVTYQWKKAVDNVPGGNGPTLTISPLSVGDTGSYSVVVTGDHGQVTSSTVTLTVVAREEGKNDPTFAQLSQTRIGTTVVLNDYSLVELSGNYITRVNDAGTSLASRNLTGMNYSQMIVDSSGRILLIGTIAPQIVRLNPATLADDTSLLGPNLGGSHTAIAEWPGRGYLVGTAGFATIDGLSVNPLILLRYDGTVDPSFNTGESTFESSSNFPSWVWVAPDGKIYVRGGAINAGSLVNGGYILRLNANGTLDTTFDPAGLTSLQFARGLRDGRLLVVLGGSNYQVRTLKPDGTFEATFNAADARISTVPLDMEEQSDGKLIVVGSFTTYGGVTVGKYMRLNADGTLDSTYYNAAGYGGSANITTVSYDPRGYAYYTPSSASSSATFQTSGKKGTVRVFAGKAPLAILNQSSGFRAGQGNDVTLHVIATGTSPVSYQWFRNSQPIAYGTNSTLTLTNYQAGNTGTYTVRISNSSGSQTSQPVLMDIVSAPEIHAQPISADKALNSSYALSVGVLGSDLMTFRWRKNGVPLNGATSRILSFGSLQFTNAGRYTVVVTNSFGAVTSAEAVLTVNTNTGIFYSTFNPVSVNNQDVHAVEVLADKSVLVGGKFTTVAGVSHAFFTRLTQTGAAVPGGWSENPPGGATGIAVYDFELLSDGKVLMGGDFTAVQGSTYGRLARLNADGTVDTSFVNPAFNADVQCVAQLPDGKILVGGNFTSPRQRLARLNADGSLDTSFTLNASGSVLRMKVLANGKVMLAGSFGQLGTQSFQQIARLNADLTIDSTFVPTTIPGTIYGFDVDDLGRVVIGGNFTTVGGVSRSRLARLNANGSHDTTFPDPGTLLLSDVRVVDIQLNGKIVVGGATNPRRLLRFKSDGTQDPFFDSTTAQPFGNVLDLQTTSDGLIYVGGQFTSPRSKITVYTTDTSDPAVTSSPQSVAVNLGGSTTLSVGVFTSTSVTYQWFKNGDLLNGQTSSTLALAGVIREDAGNYHVDVSNEFGTASSREAIVTVLAEPIITTEPVESLLAVTGGTITLNAGVQGRAPLTYLWKKDNVAIGNGARFSGAGTANLNISNAELGDSGIYTVTVSNDLGSDTSRNVYVTVIIPPGGIKDTYSTVSTPGGLVRAIQALPGGDLVIGGDFTTFRGETHNRLARMTADGAVVSSFTANVNGSVYDIAVQPDGKFIIVGSFTQVNSTTANRVARLELDGTLDSTFNAGTGPNSTVYGVALQADGKVLLVGQFSQVASASGTAYAARLNSNGTVDTTFNVSANHYGWDVAVQPDGKILIGGQGGIAGKAYLARVNPDGSADSTFSPAFNSYVYRIRLLEDGKMLVAGLFTSANSAPVTGMVKLNANGTTDATFAGVPSGTGSVWAMQEQYDSKVVLAGSFTTFNSASRNRITRVGMDGANDPLFDVGTGFGSGQIEALHITAAGHIWAGGSFTNFNGTSVTNLVQINGDPVLLTITSHPQPVTVDVGQTAQFTVTATGTSTISYQWFKGSNSLSGQTSATLTLNSVTKNDAGNYTVVVSNNSGSKSSRAAVLTVRAEPVIAGHPQAQTVSTGSSVSFTVNVTGASPLAYQWRKNGTNIPDANNASLNLSNVQNADAGVYDVVVSNSHGTFTSFEAGLGVYTAVGGVSGGFNPGTGPNNSVYAVLELPNGNVAIGGDFTTVAGVARSRFAVLDSSGALVSLASNPSFASQVNSLAVQTDGKIIAGGYFGIQRLNTDGSVDNTFASNGDQVTAFHVNGSTLYVGGYFGGSAKQVRKYSLVDGIQNTSFNANATVTTGWQVYALHVQSNGKVLVGDAFGRMARLNTDGTTDESFVAPTISYSGGGPRYVYAIAQTADGKIWIGGHFDGVTASTNRRYLARLSDTGALDTDVGDLVLNGDVRAILPVGNDVLVAGQFSKFINPSTYGTLIRVAGGNGAIDTTFGPVTSDIGALAMVRAADGNVILGGNFTTLRARVAKIVSQYSGGQQIVSGPSAVSIEQGKPFSLTVGWYGGSPATYQWYKNGQPVSNATNQSHVVNSATPDDVGTYYVTVTTGGIPLTSGNAAVSAPPAGATFANWASSNGLTGGQNGPNDDPDGDGLKNIGEFAFGSLPNQSNSANEPAGFSVNDSGVIYPAVRYIRNKLAAGITIQVTASANVTFSPTVPTTTLGPVDLGGDLEQVTVRANTPLSSTTTVFFLVTVVRP